MGVPLAAQNAGPPQWFLEVKESFVASRNRAQGELTSLKRKVTIITVISTGLMITGVALTVAGFAAAAFAAFPALLVGSAALSLLITCGAGGTCVLGIGLMALGVFTRHNKMSENCYRRTEERQAEVDANDRDLNILNRFETSESLLRYVDRYKNSPARYSIDLYRYRYYSELFKENKKEIDALRRELSQYMGDITWIPGRLINFHIDENVREYHLNQIEGAERRERCRQLLGRLEATVHTAEKHFLLRREADEHFVHYVPPEGWPPIPEGVTPVYRLYLEPR